MPSIQLAGGWGQAEKLGKGWPNLYGLSDDDGNPLICSCPKEFKIGLILDLEEFKGLTGCGNW